MLEKERKAVKEAFNEVKENNPKMNTEQVIEVALSTLVFKKEKTK